MIPVSTDVVPNRPDGRAARRQAFVDAARDAFLADGYGDTTMSAIAAKVGGSKTTLWTYFPSKQDLFTAVIDDVVAEFGQALTVGLTSDQPVEITLRYFATALMETVLSPAILALHRVVTGEAQRFPELGAMFYERGPLRGKTRLAGYIAAAMAEGRLRQGDPMIAARQFAAMCQSGCFQEVLLNVAGSDAKRDAARDVEAAVDTFVRAWGAG